MWISEACADRILFKIFYLRWNGWLMSNVHLRYNPPISWRIMFWSGGNPRHFSSMKKFRSLVVPGGGWRKGITIKGILTPTEVLPNGISCLIRKGDVPGASINVPVQRNSAYAQTVRRSIYNTRRPKQPHSPTRRYKRRPPETRFTAPLYLGFFD